MLGAILTTTNGIGAGILAAFIAPQLGALAVLHRRGMLPDQRKEN